MSKDKKHYICSNCGNISPKWLRKCFDCGLCGSIVKEKVSANKAIIKIGSKQDFDKLGSNVNEQLRIPTPIQVN